MFVAATTECFPELSHAETLEKLVDLEFTSVELTIGEKEELLKPSLVLADFDEAVNLCHNVRRLHVAAFKVNIDAQLPNHDEQFAACCRLAKAVKVVTIVVPSSELGTPFNEEVERLRRMVDIASLEGVRVGVKSQIGRLTEDPDTVSVLCDNANGLGLAFDPSHYIFGPHRGRRIDKLMKYVYHVHLRDTNKDALQVRIGQGEVDYGKLISQLRAERYDRALSVDVTPLPDIDHMGEMRKLRLLLESLLL